MSKYKYRLHLTNKKIDQFLENTPFSGLTKQRHPSTSLALLNPATPGCKQLAPVKG